MKRSNRLRIVLSFALLAVTAVVLTPRATLEDLFQGLAGDARGSRPVELSITLSVPQQPSFVYRVAISRMDLSQLKSSPEQAPRSTFVVEARKALAEKLGYGKKVYGDASYKVLTGIYVQLVEARDGFSSHPDVIFRKLSSDRQGQLNLLD